MMSSTCSCGLAKVDLKKSVKGDFQTNPDFPEAGGYLTGDIMHLLN